MRTTELSSPIRILWDIGPETSGPVDHRQIAREITENKVLNLQITESAAKLGQACFAILDELKAVGIGLSLVAPHSALDASSLERLSTSPLRMLLLSTASSGDLGSFLEAKELIDGKVSIGMAFPVTRENASQLPEVLAFCVQHRIPHLMVPIQRFTQGGECLSLSLNERQALSERLARIDRPSWLKIVIHDPFLWRAFFPTIEFPDGGCQAANTMLYFDASGDVYPCPALPIKLGNLMREPLRSIIHSERKKELRASLVELPRECLGCDIAFQCHGGCRGRGYWMTDSLQSADPACR
jgi:GeoRSP system SPASM domain protein